MSVGLKASFVCSMGLAVPLAASFGAQAEDLTEKTGKQLLNELRKLRQVLQRIERQRTTRRRTRRDGPPQVVTVSEGDGPALGRAMAPLTLVEFTDLQCAACKRFHATTFKAIKKSYIDVGALRYVSRDLPLANHPNAFTAARAVRCAGEQGRFWRMRAVMFDKAPNLSPETIVGSAQALRLDGDRFTSCFGSGKYKQQVERDIDEAVAAGLTAPPSFVLGKLGDGGVVGYTIVGAQPLAIFEQRIKLYQAADKASARARTRK